MGGGDGRGRGRGEGEGMRCIHMFTYIALCRVYRTMYTHNARGGRLHKRDTELLQEDTDTDPLLPQASSTLPPCTHTHALVM